MRLAVERRKIMAIEFSAHAEEAHLLVTVSGRLGLDDVGALHLRLLKFLAEQPAALVLDVGALQVEEPLALAVLPAVVRQAARWPGTPVLICAPTNPTRTMLAAPAYRRLPVFASAAAARDHLHSASRTQPTLADELLPGTGAARHARDLATDACLRWDLPDLVPPASLIAGELVSNVVDHAHTMMTLRLVLRPRYLQIAVRDGSSDPPVSSRDLPPGAGHGRGLLLVESLAHSWGSLPSTDGKVVWASLRRPLLGARQQLGQS
jgi:histidine kinase-like protein